MNLCPSLFNPIAAKDGSLSRLRVPGGILNFKQCEAIANLADEVQITNRANLQIRDREISEDSLKQLQDLGLAATNIELDSIRNIMSSPTAGIDSKALLDVLPLVKEWDNYLSNQDRFSLLSSKFSVGLGGGEVVSISDRANDLLLVAEKLDQEIYLRLNVCGGDRGSSPEPTRILIKPDQSIEFLAVLTEVYYNYTQTKQSGNSRLRELVADWGIELYLSEVTKLLSFSACDAEIKEKPKSANSFKHIGTHDQSQAEYAYIGIVIPLGRLSSSHFLELAAIANQYSQLAEIRLTPWQNLIIPSIYKSNIETVKSKIQQLGFSTSPHSPYAGISACIGSQGCKSSATDTQTDAQAIAAHSLKSQSNNFASEIHLSGCSKYCARSSSNQITLLGIEPSSYQVLLEDGKELADLYTLEKALELIEKLAD